jgi:hypothetical protein
LSGYSKWGDRDDGDGVERDAYCEPPVPHFGNTVAMMRSDIPEPTQNQSAQRHNHRCLDVYKDVGDVVADDVGNPPRQRQGKRIGAQNGVRASVCHRMTMRTPNKMGYSSVVRRSFVNFLLNFFI